MTCDSYYGIGDKHQVCQDYALHGHLPADLEYVIVADGCSSADYSEIGAQILCHAAKYQIALTYQTGLFNECSLKTLSGALGNSILKRIDEVRMNYPISRKALEATLLIAVYAPPKIFVFGWGDGVIIERYRLEDGTDFQAVTDIDFTNNAPFYLVCDRKDYLKGLKVLGFDEPKTFFTRYYDSPTGRDKVKNDKPLDGMPYQWLKDRGIYEEGRGKLTSITICSDGMKSFLDIDKNPIELMTIVPEIVDYKSTNGEFVKKRMFFLKRTANKNNWSHSDDISCGTIFIKKV